MCLEVRGQAAGAGSFSSLCEPQGWSSGFQAWWQAPSSFPESEVVAAHYMHACAIGEKIVQ